LFDGFPDSGNRLGSTCPFTVWRQINEPGHAAGFFRPGHPVQQADGRTSMSALNTVALDCSIKIGWQNGARNIRLHDRMVVMAMKALKRHLARLDNWMSKAMPIYTDDDIIIERDRRTRYKLRCSHCELSFNKKNAVVDQDGVGILSFKSKPEVFWDLKLVLDKPITIGVCSKQTGDETLMVQGRREQKLFYQGRHILSQEKKAIVRGPDFVLENKEHVALLFVMVVSKDRMET
jgi:hypothetical protein